MWESEPRGRPIRILGNRCSPAGSTEGCLRQDTHQAKRQAEYERALLELRWCVFHKLGGTPEYRDLRLLARVGDWRNEADCAFADCVVASDRLPRVRWQRIPDGRIRFTGSLPRPPSEDDGSS